MTSLDIVALGVAISGLFVVLVSLFITQVIPWIKEQVEHSPPVEPKDAGTQIVSEVDEGLSAKYYQDLQFLRDIADEADQKEE